MRQVWSNLSSWSKNGQNIFDDCCFLNLNENVIECENTYAPKTSKKKVDTVLQMNQTLYCVSGFIMNSKEKTREEKTIFLPRVFVYTALIILFPSQHQRLRTAGPATGRKTNCLCQAPSQMVLTLSQIGRAHV